MKHVKISLLVTVLVATSLLVSCVPGQGQAASGWSGTAFHDGIIYAGTQDGRVVAINATSRTYEWPPYLITDRSSGILCSPAEAAVAIYTTPLVDGDSVYIGTYGARGGRVYALRTTSGSAKWVYPAEPDRYAGVFVGSPTIADGTVHFTSSDGRVYALQADNGDELWRSQRIADKIWTGADIVGDTLYVSDFDGRIHALSANTGELLDWSLELQGGLASSPVVHEGVVYVGSFDNNLYAIEVADSEPLWTFAGRKWFWAAPIVHEGIVYAGCLDGTLYALDSETGQRLWDFDAGSPIVARPVVESEHSMLIVAAESGNIYFFDLDAVPGGQSTPLKTASVGAAIKSTFCAAEGFVYLRGEDNVIYVVDIVTGWVAWEFPLTSEE